MLNEVSMTTTLILLGGGWTVLSWAFCLALCMAAAKRLPPFEPGAECLEPRGKTAEAINEDALFAR
ncbi:MAG: hypothetical protein DME18_15835 [Verrucomicrobia bacterium]|nr:MAG: hypothetical protein DME18_15835 [Verrucomicrobiota bacterium]